MLFFAQKRFIFQQAPPQPTPEQQGQAVEAGKEAVPAATEALPVSADALSKEYKDKGKKMIDGGTTKINSLDI